ncbi:MAG: hypothetical protein JNK08_00335 [Sediminibacterium sp.]|nr:hypothetical protein [Sediminibacterium sp.]
MSQQTFRWDPYVLRSGEGAIALLTEHFCSERQSNILFILGKGFDIRMNQVLSQLTDIGCQPSVDCMLISFNEGDTSVSHQYKAYVDENMRELNEIVPAEKFIHKSIQLWKQDGNKRRRVGDWEAAEIITDFSCIERYTDIIIDISALPRGIYFSLLGKILSLIDTKPDGTPLINLIITVSENARFDACVKEDGTDPDTKFLKGFGGQIKPGTERNEPLIWFPILGEEKDTHIRKAGDFLNANEICPIFPFPSKDPRRADKLLVNYHGLLLDELRIEPQSIMYVPEQNPFEAYKALVRAIRNFQVSFRELNGCRAALSTFSSKLLSIGTFLAAYQINNVDRQNIVGVANVDSPGYILENEATFADLKKESELFVIWITGEPYE